MRRVLSLHPMLLFGLALLLAFAVAVLALPFAALKAPDTPAAAPTTSSGVSPYGAEPTPEYCLTDLPPHFYAENPVDQTLAGPGNFTHKESASAFGPSAEVADREGLTAERRVEEVRHEFERRHCGGGTNGGDKKLFQVGFVGSDVNNLTMGPSHPLMNPNSTIDRFQWEVGLEGYLMAIRWDLSYLVYEKLGADTWTLVMEPRPGLEPLVKLVRHEQPASVYLMLAVTQPDGTSRMERRRLACGFQLTFVTYEDIPAAFRQLAG